MARPDPKDFIFKKLTGQTLIKAPGTINGNGFVLDTLVDCEVYLLDHTSQVQVDDCVNCKIFIGPTDGSVFIRDCRDCTLCVAARQLRTRDCKDLAIALYCATQPSIETSTGIAFSCWRGAYPGLGEHFAKAKLDPARNTYTQIYDFNSKEDLGAVHWTLDESVHPWWVAPLPEGGGGAPADCPVPAPDGSLFGGGRAELVPPKSPGGSHLPASLPPSPGRAAAYDEEVDLDDDPDEQPTVLPPGVEDGGVSWVQPAQPSPGGGGGAGGAGGVAQPVWELREDGQGEGGGSGEGGEAGGFSFRMRGAPLTVEVGQGGAGGAGSSAPEAQQVDLAVQGAGVAAHAAGAAGGAPAAGAGSNGGGAGAAAGAGASGGGSGGGAAGGVLAEGDARLAWRSANAARLRTTQAEERAAKEQALQEARAKLEALRKSRDAQLKQRHATNRTREATSAVKGDAEARAAVGWARVAALVDLGKGSGGAAAAAAAGGAVHAPGSAGGPHKDVGRMKHLIIALKTKQPAK